MKKGASASHADPDDAPVRLQPIFGIRPGVYLSAVYLVLIFLLLFVLLLLPGIRRFGSRLTVTSTPDGATVLVDGKRLGTTPVTAFVPAGEREIVVSKPFFGEYRNTLDVGGRILGSLIVPRKERIDTRLSPVRADDLLQAASRDFAGWALTGPATDRYPKPPVLTDTLRDLLSSVESGGMDESIYNTLYEFLYNASQSAVSGGDAAELLRAAGLTEAGGGALSPTGLLRLVKKFIQFQEESRFSGFWLLSVLPEDARRVLLGSAWYEGYLKRYDELVDASAVQDAPETGQARLIDGRYRFYRIPGGPFVFGRSPVNDGPSEAQVVPYPVTIETFFLMDREVTREMYARFLSDHPEWRPAAHERLAAEGLVGDEYLADWGDGAAPEGEPDTPVRYVSWFAADAFCRWLEAKLPADMAGFTVRLPTEAEWEYAARRAAVERGDEVFRDVSLNGPLPVRDRAADGPADLLGNLWEWTSDWYYPASYLFGADRNVGSWDGRFPGAERVVKGGSWANAREGINTVLRGAQPPEWTTPFIGFRPVIVRERNGS